MAEQTVNATKHAHDGESEDGFRNVRMRVPKEDDVVMAFLDKQGTRSVSSSMRSLIHLFVSEYGDVEVATVVGQRLAGMHIKGGVPVGYKQLAEKLAVAQPVEGEQVQVDVVVAEPEAEPEFVEKQEKPAQPVQAAADFDMDEMMGGASVAPAQVAQPETAALTKTPSKTQVKKQPPSDDMGDLMEQAFR